MAQPDELETVKKQVLAQIQSFALEIEDSDLRQEAERALKSLEDFEGDSNQFLIDANEILSNLVMLVGEYDKRRESIRALYADLDEIQQAAATPEGLVEILSCLDYPEARQVAIDLIQATSILVQLSRGMFIGESAETIRENARRTLRDLLSTEKGPFQSNIATMYGFGAARILRAIRRDPTGSELRLLIQDERINFPLLISVAKHIVDDIQQEILNSLVQDAERELAENVLAYIVPREERRPDDPLIVRLGGYMDPQLLIQSRLATPLERTLKRKAVSIFAEFLKLTDDLTRLLNLFPANLHPTDRKAMSKDINTIQEFVRKLHETSSMPNLSELDHEEETERHFLLLLLRKEFLSELRKRISLVYGQFSEESPLPKDTHRFFEHEITTYVDDFAKTMNEPSVAELQANLAAWRQWLHRIETKFQIPTNSLRPFLKFASDRFIAMDSVTQYPKHLLKVIAILKRRKRLATIARKANSSEDALTRLEVLFTSLENRLSLENEI